MASHQPERCGRAGGRTPGTCCSCGAASLAQGPAPPTPPPEAELLIFSVPFIASSSGPELALAQG